MIYGQKTIIYKTYFGGSHYQQSKKINQTMSILKKLTPAVLFGVKELSNKL